MAATNCAEAGLGAGSCIWSNTTSCYVERGKCYCDSCCEDHGDCCTDVTHAQSKLDAIIL